MVLELGSMADTCRLSYTLVVGIAKLCGAGGPLEYVMNLWIKHDYMLVICITAM